MSSTPSTPTVSKAEVLARFPEPRTNTAQFQDNLGYDDEILDMRRVLGVKPYDREAFTQPPVPDLLEHYWEPPGRQYQGGTEVMVRGGFGSGKSTFARVLALRVLDINTTIDRGHLGEGVFPEKPRRETVIWRGSSKRSEWLPFAPWARLCLPTDVPVRATLDPKRKSLPEIELSMDDVEQIVREVVYYDSPSDLNKHKLRVGGFNVVYPDPDMKGCQSLYESTPEYKYDAPPRGELFHPEDSADHWWFGWFLSRIVDGPFSFTTWMTDEIGDFLNQDAAKDNSGTYQKVKLLSDAWADARKKGLSIFSFAQDQHDIHDRIRRKMRWRCQMATQSNPTNGSEVVGFGVVPMDWGALVRDKPVGWVLCFTESRFERFKFPEISYDQDYILSLFVGDRR